MPSRCTCLGGIASSPCVEVLPTTTVATTTVDGDQSQRSREKAKGIGRTDVGAESSLAGVDQAFGMMTLLHALILTDE